MADGKSTTGMVSATSALAEEGFQMYLGQKCRLTGVLKVQGMMHVDGFVEGEIIASDLIKVGKEGKIEATMNAKHIVAQGPLSGEITAQEKIELLAPAKVEGSIDSPVFLLEEGVLVNGILKMTSPPPSLQ